MLRLRKGNSQNTLVLLEYNEMILPSLTFMMDPTINVRGKNTINNIPEYLRITQQTNSRMEESQLDLIKSLGKFISWQNKISS